MANSRDEVGDFLSVHARPGLTPVASPVDTYVRPAEKPTRGASLLGALSELDQALSPALNRAQAEAAEKETAEGQEAFNRSRLQFSEAVRSGEIPAGASPFVRRGWRKSELQSTASTYNIELARALEQSGLAAESDPAAVRQFVDDFRLDFEERNGIGTMPADEVAEFYRPVAMRAEENFFARQAEENIAHVETSRVRAFEREVYTAVMSGRFGGSTTNSAAAAKNLGGFLQAKVEELKAEGISPTVIEKVVLDAVTLAAGEQGDHAVLDVLDRVSIFDGTPVGAGLAGIEAKVRVQDAIAAHEERKSRAAEEAVKKERERASEETMIRAAQAHREGRFEEAQRIVGDLANTDPDKWRAWVNFTQEEAIARDKIEGEVNFGATRMAVKDASSATDAYALIDEDFSYGRITAEERTALRKYAEDRFDGGAGADILKRVEDDSSFKRSVREIADTVGTPPVSGYDEATYKGRAAKAEADLTDAALTWMDQNTDADGNYDRLAFRDFLQKETERTKGAYAEEFAPVEEALGIDDTEDQDHAEGGKPLSGDYESKMKGVSAPAKGALSNLLGTWGDLDIISTYRDPGHNQKVGGAKKSEHMHGNAFDVSVRGMPHADRVRLIKAARAAGFRGIGVYADSLHFDVGGDRSWGPDYTHKTLPAWAREAVSAPVGGGAATGSPDDWDN